MGTDRSRRIAFRSPCQSQQYITGWQVTESRDSNGTPNYLSFTVHLQRGIGLIGFDIFLMALMWALALAGLAMTLMLVLLHRRIDAGPLTYLAALLFAFPIIRTQALPGSPALGELFDYASFFWAEVIVAISLMVLLIAWILRDRHPEHEESENLPKTIGP